MNAQSTKSTPAPVTKTSFRDGVPVKTETIQPGEQMNAQAQATSTAASPKATAPAADPKVPADSKLVRDATFTLVKPADENVKHHQQKVLMEVLTAGKTALKDVVESISSDQALVTRMNTRQPIERCVRYHSKWLADHGYIKIVKAEKPKTEAKAEKPAAGKTPTAPAKTEAPSKLAS